MFKVQKINQKHCQNFPGDFSGSFVFILICRNTSEHKQNVKNKNPWFTNVFSYISGQGVCWLWVIWHVAIRVISATHKHCKYLKAPKVNTHPELMRNTLANKVIFTVLWCTKVLLNLYKITDYNWSHMVFKIPFLDFEIAGLLLSMGDEGA